MLLVRVEFFQIGAFGAEKITVEISIIQRVKKHITPENAPSFLIVSNSPNPLLQFSFSAFSRKFTQNCRNLQFSLAIWAIFSKQKLLSFSFTKKFQNFRKNRGGKFCEFPHCAHSSVVILFRKFTLTHFWQKFRESNVFTFR